MAGKGSIVIPAIVLGFAAAMLAPTTHGDGDGVTRPDDATSSGTSAGGSGSGSGGGTSSAGGSGSAGSGSAAARSASFDDVDPPAQVEGVDPETTVCADTARTVQGKNASSGGKVYAHVELRYSPVCRASWVRTRGSAGEPGKPVGTWGQVVRPSDGTTRSTSHCSDATCWSDMVDVAGTTAYARGGFDYAGVDVSVRTRSY